VHRGVPPTPRMIKRSLQGVKRSCSGHADELPVTGWLDSALALGVKVALVCEAVETLYVRRVGPRRCDEMRSIAVHAVGCVGARPGTSSSRRGLARALRAGGSLPRTTFAHRVEARARASTRIRVSRRLSGRWRCLAVRVALRTGVCRRGAISPDESVDRGGRGLFSWRGAASMGACGLATSRDSSHGGCGTIGRYDLR